MAVRHIILGTAGHIDHGKTTFIKALTGVDCDRLKEEKERGITIELGYASMALPSGVKIGIVDVPGHERFVSKMVSGASGIDIVAFIVAADEGVKPQTREHLHICDLLGVKKGIIVLTKKDLVDQELLQIQTEDVRDLIKGTFLKDAAIIPVSSITGDGLKQFTAELEKLAADINLRSTDTPFRLPIDDVMTIKGFGTVARGTAISGSIQSNEEIVISPKGIKSRVRGIQSHGKSIEHGFAGERLALNLSDISKEDIDRGMVVVKDGFFLPTTRLFVEFQYLSYNEKPLKSRFNCQFHILTTRVQAELFLIEAERLLPGEKCYAAVRLEHPIIASYGDTFIIRGYGIYTTLGGGKILNPQLPTFKKEYLVDRYCDVLAKGDKNALAALFIQEHKEAGLSLNRLCGLLNIPMAEVRTIIDGLKRNGVIFEDDRRNLYHKACIETLKDVILKVIGGYHKANPLKAGLSKEELLVTTGGHSQLFALVLRMLSQERKIEMKGDLAKDIAFNPAAAGGDEIFGKIEKLYAEFGLQPADMAEIALKLKLDEKKLKDAHSSLVKSARLIKIKDDYYVHPAVFEKTKEAIIHFFQKKPLLTPQDARDILGVSRKYMIPFLEYMDSIKLTIRVQDGRKLRK